MVDGCTVLWFGMYVKIYKKLGKNFILGMWLKLTANILAIWNENFMFVNIEYDAVLLNDVEYILWREHTNFFKSIVV